MTQSVKRGSVDRLLTLFALTVLLVASSVPAAVHGDDDSLFAGRKPLVAQRVGMVTASTHLGEVYRPDLFDRTIQALPSLGLNGVLLIVSTAHGTSAGRDLLPQILDDDQKIKAWSQMFDRIKALGLNVYVSFSPLIPPEFTREQLKAHYAGRQKLKELPDAIRAATETQANAVFTTFAQVDGLMLHSLELEPVWGPAVSPYPARDVPAAEQALGAYLDGLEAACRRHKKQTWFWAHVWGVTPPEIRSIRRVLSEHPDVVTLEDHYWPNVGWPTLPFLGYLPLDLRDTRGFMRVEGTVTRVARGGGAVWINLEGRFAVRIADRDLKWFPTPPRASWTGREIQVQGWVYRSKAELRMNLHHPAAMRLDDTV